MERLTFVKSPKYWNEGRHPTKYTSRKTLQEVVDRLAYYEDMEEQGRIVVLPCKVGDTVWVNFAHHMLVPKPVKPVEAVVKKIKAVQFADGSTRFFADVEFNVADPFYHDGRLMVCGASVVVGAAFGGWDIAFLTREEAEKALKGGAN